MRLMPLRAPLRCGLASLTKGCFGNTWWSRGVIAIQPGYACVDHEWPALRVAYETWLKPENFSQRWRSADYVSFTHCAATDCNRLSPGAACCTDGSVCQLLRRKLDCFERLLNIGVGQRQRYIKLARWFENPVRLQGGIEACSLVAVSTADVTVIANRLFTEDHVKQRRVTDHLGRVFGCPASTRECLS